MDKNFKDFLTLENIIIIIVVFLLIFGVYSFFTHAFVEEDVVVGNYAVVVPVDSECELVSDGFVSTNPNEHYNFEMHKLNSSSSLIQDLVNEAKQNDGAQASVEYFNDTHILFSQYYLMGQLNYNFSTGDYAEYSMIIPRDSFDIDNFEFKEDTPVYLFAGHDSSFIKNKAYTFKIR